MALPVAIGAAIPGILALLSDVFDGLDGQQKVKAEQAMKLLEMAQSDAEGQRQVNQAEASHRSIFVAGWRPFIGWICGLSLCYAFLLQPLLVSLLPVIAPDFSGTLPEFPMDYLMELMLGMLGIGGLRTFEKWKGVSR